MTLGVGANNALGIAFETTPGTYVAPTKFFAFRSENLQHRQGTVWRRPTRGTADLHGAVAGNVHIEGDFTIEVLEDVLPYLLYAGRWSIVKSGSTPNFVYTATPTHTATTATGRTLSITVLKNGVVFGWVGCSIVSMSFTIEDGVLLVGTFNVIGLDEATAAVPTPVYATDAPFGAGMYSIEIPTGSAVEDTDTFTIGIDNSGEPLHRLRTTRAAKAIKYGDRNVTAHFERDFQDRTDFDAYKALTSQSLTVKATKGANNEVAFLIPAAIRDAYETQGAAQADLIRYAIDYRGTYNAGTSKSMQITVKTQEDIS